MNCWLLEQSNNTINDDIIKYELLRKFFLNVYKTHISKKYKTLLKTLGNNLINGKLYHVFETQYC